MMLLRNILLWGRGGQIVSSSCKILPCLSPPSSAGKTVKFISTANVALRDRNPASYFRVSSDHRGNITPGNRPESEHSIDKEGKNPEVLDESEYAALLHDAENFGASVVSKAALKGGITAVLPWVKWGRKKKLITTPDRLLDEATALVSTLPHVTLLDKLTVKVRVMSSATIFGPGQVEELKVRLENKAVSALFVVVNRLNNVQVRTLERELNVRVVDRFWVVLAIFHQHANTVEARMQVALAELPYIRSLTKQPSEQSLIDRRIRSLQAALNKLLRHRSHIRQQRRHSDFPSVAVVGYTNAGKTSLISCLSGDTNVQGKEQLFATLDVTAHGFSLPCGSNCVLLDTVGFIQDLPTELVASFNATLQDACHAEVIIHVRDMSHPDRVLQHTTVMAALYTIGLPFTTPIITVDNKADLLPKGARTSNVQNFSSYLPSDETYKSLCQQRFHLDDESMSANVQSLQQLQAHFENTPALAVSAKTKEGLVPLVETLEEKILETTHKRLFRMKLPTGGPHLRLLRSVAGNAKSVPCVDDPNKSEIVAALSDKQLALFRKLCLTINSNS